MRRIVTDVARFYNEYSNLYHATVLGLFAYYGNDKEYRSRVSGDQKLALKPFQPGPTQLDRQYVVYSGSQPLGTKTIVLTKFGTRKASDTNTTTVGCGLGFFGSTGNRRGLDTCALLSGIDFPPPNRPSNSDSVATWSEYQTALNAWAQKNSVYLPGPQQQKLQALRDYASARVEAGGSQPSPGPDPDEVADEEWPTWADGTTFPRYPPGDATAQTWQIFKRRTFAYMTDKDSELSSVQFEQLNARIDLASIEQMSQSRGCSQPHHPCRGLVHPIWVHRQVCARSGTVFRSL